MQEIDMSAWVCSFVHSHLVCAREFVRFVFFFSVSSLFFHLYFIPSLILIIFFLLRQRYLKYVYWFRLFECVYNLVFIFICFSLDTFYGPVRFWAGVFWLQFLGEAKKRWTNKYVHIWANVWCRFDLGKVTKYDVRIRYYRNRLYYKNDTFQWMWWLEFLQIFNESLCQQCEVRILICQTFWIIFHASTTTMAFFPFLFFKVTGPSTFCHRTNNFIYLISCNMVSFSQKISDTWASR